ncbi:MAG: 50S ribosomal protein L30 [Bdellovibrionales bacterium]|nr:50S ribosomal protein L30 [Bdellovibrionales bacterium]
MAKTFKVKLKKSLIGRTQKQKDAVRCLGLRKIGQEVVVADNPAVRGQIMKIQHMLDVTVEK